MSVRTISEDTIIENICYDDLIITSGANVTLKGTLYGNVDVKDNSHFQLLGRHYARKPLCFWLCHCRDHRKHLCGRDPGFWSSDHLWSGDIHQRPLSCQYAPWCLCKHDPALILCSCSCHKNPGEKQCFLPGIFLYNLLLPSFDSSKHKPSSHQHHNQNKRSCSPDHHVQIGAAQCAEKILQPVLVHCNPEIFFWECIGIVAITSLPHLFNLQAAAFQRGHILPQSQVDGKILETIPHRCRSDDSSEALRI